MRLLAGGNKSNLVVKNKSALGGNNLIPEKFTNPRIPGCSGRAMSLFRVGINMFFHVNLFIVVTRSLFLEKIAFILSAAKSEVVLSIDRPN